MGDEDWKRGRNITSKDEETYLKYCKKMAERRKQRYRNEPDMRIKQAVYNRYKYNKKDLVIREIYEDSRDDHHQKLKEMTLYLALRKLQLLT